MSAQFKVGDGVEWSARAVDAKNPMTILARVVCVVPAGKRVPGLYLSSLGSAGHTTRSGVSYIVKTDAGRIYWPATEMLRAPPRSVEE